MVPPVVLAIVEGQEEAAAFVPTFIGIGTHAESTPLQLHHADEHAQEISQVPKGLEDAVGQRADVRGKSHAQKIEGINSSCGVAQAKQIHAALAAREQRFDGASCAILREVAEKRVAGTQRQKSQFNSLGKRFAPENSIEDFVRGAVTTTARNRR